MADGMMAATPSDDERGKAASVDVTLPFDFDTGGPIVGLARLFAGLAVSVLVGGLIKFTLVEPSVVSAFGVVVVGWLLGLVAWLLIRRLAGATGTVTQREIVIRPRRVFGITSNDPRGSFSLDHFSALRVERIQFAANRYAPHERVCLVGNSGTVAIVIAHTRRGAGIDLARQLGRLLNLPVTETLAPY